MRKLFLKRHLPGVSKLSMSGPIGRRVGKWGWFLVASLVVCVATIISLLVLHDLGVVEYWIRLL